MPLHYNTDDILKNARISSNLTVPQLLEIAISRHEGILTNTGAFSVTTGKYTGRSPNDKFFVKDSFTSSVVNWGSVNQSMSPENFNNLYSDITDYLKGRELFVFDGYAGADPNLRKNIRVVNELAWQNLFIHQMLIRPEQSELTSFIPEFHIISAPGFHADPKRHGTNSEVAIAVNLSERIIIIVGTHYAGEIKKSVFTLVNFVLPQENVLSMHCSANKGKNGDTALFFGLSGTGKTTLSADPDRFLIGDDEHGWSNTGIFNIEGGCYAKCIGLSAVDEPQIWQALRFGSVLENVIVDETSRIPDYDSKAITENTRSAYPVDHIPNPVIPGIGGHPSNIFFLTADAFGVLPPIALLNNEQAMYHFLSGYTSKLAGTERGIVDPETTFSECFGAPFLPLPPITYAELLGKKLTEHGTKVFLVNTGWTGGPYGVGHRFKISHTRAFIKTALEGNLTNIPNRTDPYFGFQVPLHCPGVPDEVLNPEKTWSDPAQYRAMAEKLARRFSQNFTKFKGIPENILAAGPLVK